MVGARNKQTGDWTTGPGLVDGALESCGKQWRDGGSQRCKIAFCRPFVRSPPSFAALGLGVGWLGVLLDSPPGPPGSPFTVHFRLAVARSLPVADECLAGRVPWL